MPTTTATAATTTTLTARQARWLAIGAQGLGRTRPAATVGRRQVQGAIEGVGTIQLDAINVVERTQFLVLFSRLGAYDVARIHETAGPGGTLFEYWGHAASLMPVDRQPLFRWRMAQGGWYASSPSYAATMEQWRRAHADYIAATLAEVGERGPLTAAQLTDPRRRDGEWWGRRSVGRQALEWLFANGELAGWRAPNFARVYDLPDRVIPEAVLARPTPDIDDAQRQLILLSARSVGVGTVTDLADYYRLKPAVARVRVAELVEDGALVAANVEGWREPGYLLPGTRARRPTRRHATLLSPFDSLIWERARTQRLFGFDYRIEVYVPGPKRVHGYYVFPMLLGDALVGRLDLKADRRTSTLRVAGAFAEPGFDLDAVAVGAADELDSLRRWLGLDSVAVASKGDLVPALAAALHSRVQETALDPR